MDKIEFNKLDIQQQVGYINEGLKTQSLTKVCEVIGISEATVRDRFKRKGYTRQGKAFIPIGTTEKNKPTKTMLVDSIENNIKQYIENNTSNTKNTSTTKSQKKNSKLSDIKVLENRIDSLEAQIKAVMDIINRTNTVNKAYTTEIKKYEGTTVSRNYRINKEIQQEFKLLCNKFTAGTEYTVTDIISLALEDFINKYK